MNFEHILIIIWYYYIRVIKTIIIIVIRVIINFEQNIYVKEFLWRIFSNKISFLIRQKSIVKSIMKAFIMTIECSNLPGCLSDKFVIQNSWVLHFDSIFNPAMRYSIRWVSDIPWNLWQNEIFFLHPITDDIFPVKSGILFFQVHPQILSNASNFHFELIFHWLKSEKVVSKTGETYVIEKYPDNSSDFLNLNCFFYCCLLVETQRRLTNQRF